MKKSSLLCLVFGILFSTSSLWAQDLNDYKYIIVPHSYDFFDEPDRYQINSLTKFLFNKYGFTAIMDNEVFPLDLGQNKCLALKANVLRSNSMLKTKLSVELKDCTNNVVFESAIGASREKEFKKAYHEALRSAFKSFESKNYSYKAQKNADKPIKDDVIVSVTKTDSPKEKPKQYKVKMVKEEKRPTTQSKVVTKKKAAVLKQVKTQTEPLTKSILYAQATSNGFQVVDNTPKIVMILLNSGKSDTYMVKGRNAIVYKEDGFWYLSENNGSSSDTKRLDIKF